VATPVERASPATNKVAVIWFASDARYMSFGGLNMRRILINTSLSILAAAVFTPIISIPAEAVVCARGVRGAGCAGPNGAVAVGRPVVAPVRRGAVVVAPPRRGVVVAPVRRRTVIVR
jgi:hypothetical protein